MGIDRCHIINSTHNLWIEFILLNYCHLNKNRITHECHQYRYNQTKIKKRGKI